jgi:hypothetical protein
MKSFSLFIIFSLFISLSFSSCYINHYTKKIEGVGKSTQSKADIDITGVTRVSINGSIDIELIPSEEYKVLITAQENIKEYIQVNVNGDIVKVGIRPIPKTNIVITDETKVSLFLPSIRELNINGSGDILCRKGFNLKSDLILAINGSGDIDIDGIYCHNLISKTNGSGDIEINNITCKEIKTTINGSGNIEIENVKCEQITTQNHASGDVKYAGLTNKHDLHIHGSGDIDVNNLKTRIVNVNTNGSGNSYVWALDKLVININGSGNVYYKGPDNISIRKNGSGKAVTKS